MKKCPYCAEEIQEDAIKCRYCGEMLEKKPLEGKRYFKTQWVIIAFLCVGPLALPLVWFNPRYSLKTKIIVTIIVIILSYYLSVWFMNSLRTVKQYYGVIFQNSL